MRFLPPTEIENRTREVACNKLEIHVERNGRFGIPETMPDLLLARLRFESTVINWMTSIAEAPSAESWRCAVLGQGVSNRVIWSERSANQSQDSLRVSNATWIKPAPQQYLFNA